MSRWAVSRIESMRRRNCALSHRPPIVPSARVAATAQPKAERIPRKMSSERRRSSPTTRVEPSESGVDERPNDFRLRLGRLVALRLARLHPAAGASPPGRADRRRAASRPGLAAHRRSRRRLRRAPREFREPLASPLREGALQRVGLLDDPVVEIGQDFVADRKIDEGAERQRGSGEQREIDRRQPEAGRSKQPDLGHATNIRRRARSGSARLRGRDRSSS